VVVVRRPVVVVRRPVVVVLRPVVVVRRPVVVAVVPEVVEVVGHSDRSKMKSEQDPVTGPEAVPGTQESVDSHQPQKGSRKQVSQSSWFSQSRNSQLSKNHSVQLRAEPPGPTALPVRHSLVLSHQPQLPVASAVQSSQEVFKIQES
jgi:hypothetical protein